MPNNSQRRRAKKATTVPKGVRTVYNEGQTRKERRTILNTFVRCKACNDRILVKNLTNHVRHAMLHEDMYKEMIKEGVLD